MKRNKIRLTESQLNKMIKESVKRALNESISEEDAIQDVLRKLVEALDIADKLMDVADDYDSDASRGSDIQNAVNVLHDCYNTFQRLGLNGRGGTFDSHNGYLSAGY